MREQTVEIYSDQTNVAVLRHPDRRFPGILIQGDSLYTLCMRADAACAGADKTDEAYQELNALRNALWSYLLHYKAVLGEHGIPLPFAEASIE